MGLAVKFLTEDKIREEPSTYYDTDETYNLGMDGMQFDDHFELSFNIGLVEHPVVYMKFLPLAEQKGDHTFLINIDGLAYVNKQQLIKRFPEYESNPEGTLSELIGAKSIFVCPSEEYYSSREKIFKQLRDIAVGGKDIQCNRVSRMNPIERNLKDMPDSFMQYRLDVPDTPFHNLDEAFNKF